MEGKKNTVKQIVSFSAMENYIQSVQLKSVPLTKP
jgi:hypothetical protein